MTYQSPDLKNDRPILFRYFKVWLPCALAHVSVAAGLILLMFRLAPTDNWLILYLLRKILFFPVGQFVISNVESSAYGVLVRYDLLLAYSACWGGVIAAMFVFIPRAPVVRR